MKKNVHFFVHFVYILKKCFFFGRKILSILNAWLYRVFFVFFFWKFMIFWKWTKKFFFNVNPYHFQTHAWLYRRKIVFLPNDTYHLLSFFLPKKKKKFFFLGPQNVVKKALAKKKWLKIFFQPKNASKMIKNFCSKKWLKIFLHSKMTIMVKKFLH